MLNREISNNKFQMDSLDGLRGFAAIIVVFSHTSLAGMYFLPGLNLQGIGKSGVFLFFLLSSFLLTLPLLEKGKDLFSIPVMSHYWQRRFFRIYPLYTLYLLLAVFSTLIAAKFLHIKEFGIPFDLTWEGFLRHMLLIEGKKVTWSIAVEFKFYFILPFLVFFIIQVRRIGTWASLVALPVLVILSQFISPAGDSVTNDPRLLPYMPIFLIGMLLAVVQDAINKNDENQGLLMGIRISGYLSLIAIIIMTPSVYSSLFSEIPYNYFHKQFLLYSVLWGLVILTAVNINGSWIQKFFSIPFLRSYGALSFSLYLFHPIFIGALNRVQLNSQVSAWAVLILASVSAYISFRVLEGPVSKYKLKKSTIAAFSAKLKRSTPS